jgi:hypothetical protein
VHKKIKADLKRWIETYEISEGGQQNFLHRNLLKRVMSMMLSVKSIAFSTLLTVSISTVSMSTSVFGLPTLLASNPSPTESTLPSVPTQPASRGNVFPNQGNNRPTVGDKFGTPPKPVKDKYCGPNGGPNAPTVCTDKFINDCIKAKGTYHDHSGNGLSFGVCHEPTG